LDVGPQPCTRERGGRLGVGSCPPSDSDSRSGMMGGARVLVTAAIQPRVGPLLVRNGRSWDEHARLKRKAGCGWVAGKAEGERADFANWAER
jgi:hypothetical protein